MAVCICHACCVCGYNLPMPALTTSAIPTIPHACPIHVTPYLLLSPVQYPTLLRGRVPSFLKLFLLPLLYASEQAFFCSACLSCCRLSCWMDRFPHPMPPPPHTHSILCENQGSCPHSPCTALPPNCQQKTGTDRHARHGTA